jgi:hypothetical protein
VKRKRIKDALVADAQLYVNTEHESEKIAALPDDHARYEYCWQRAVHFHNTWFDGQRNTVASTLASTHPRYEHVSRDELITQAKINWAVSVKARDLAEAVHEWRRWAQGYLARAQAQDIRRLVASLDNLVNALRANEN